MESGKMVGVLGALLGLCVLATMAVPKKAPRSQGALAPAAGGAGVAGHATPASTSAPTKVPSAADDLQSGVWSPAGFSFSMPAPAGWTPSRRRSYAYLHKDSAQPLAGNFNVLKLPNLFGYSPEKLRDSNRQELQSNPQFSLLSCELTKLGGRDVVRSEYTGTPRGGNPTHFLNLCWLAGSMQVTLTFTIEETAWEGARATVEEAFAALSFAAKPKGTEAGSD